MCQIAHALRKEHGIGATGPGKDVVLTISSGNPFIPVFFYSIVAAGGVFSGASTSYRTAELSHQIKDANASLLVCTPEFENITVDAAKHCGVPLDRVLILDSKTPRQWTLRSIDQTDVLQSTNSHGRSLEWQRIVDQKQLEDITICLLYSSGTTGLPKGVRLSHWSILASTICTMDVARRYKERTEKDGREFTFNTIAHLPMANIAGIALYSCNPFYMGGSTYWMEKYDFDSFIEYHRRYRPQYQFSVPPIWLRIAKSDKVTDHFDGLQVACTGSAPIGYATAMEVTSKLGKGKAYITQTWGITECAGVVTCLDWNIDDKSWSVGELSPNLRLRIVNDDDKDGEPGQPGEMLIGGPFLAQEYHNNAKATRESFVDGWYRSGDIGTIDEDGLVHIVDRKKELIKYKGNQVAPAELEALLTSHAKIADAAVIGVWSAQQETELPRAYVVRKHLDGERPITEHEIVDFVKENLAVHKQLRGGVYFQNEIPKSASGKILRKELRLMASEEAKSKL